MIQPRLPVIPSAARNLKSMTARPESYCRASIMTNSRKRGMTLYVGLTLGQTLEILRLRSAQNDSAGVSLSSMQTPSPVRGRGLG